MKDFDPFARSKDMPPLTLKQKATLWGASFLVSAIITYPAAEIVKNAFDDDLKSPPKPTGEVVNIMPSHEGEGINEIANDLTGKGYSSKELKNELKAVSDANGGNVPNDTIGIDSSLITEHDSSKLEPYGVEIDQQGQPVSPPETH